MLRLVREELVMGTFDEFWELYPRKIAKKDARSAWQRIKVTQEIWERIVRSIEAHKRTESWLERGGIYIPYASTWLNGERWDDEIQVDIQVTYCKWRGCTKPATTVLNGSDLCEGHNQARKRGESPV